MATPTFGINISDSKDVCGIKKAAYKIDSQFSLLRDFIHKLHFCILSFFEKSTWYVSSINLNSKAGQFKNKYKVKFIDKNIENARIKRIDGHIENESNDNRQEIPKSTDKTDSDSEHSDASEFICDMCLKKFKDSYKLQKHRSEAHHGPVGV